jgi:hypothetical protein
VIIGPSTFSLPTVDGSEQSSCFHERKCPGIGPHALGSPSRELMGVSKESGLKMELESSCWQGSHIAGILSLSNGQFVVDTVARKNTSNVPAVQLIA